jgi:hypothetical protein
MMMMMRLLMMMRWERAPRTREVLTRAVEVGSATQEGK